MSDNDSANLSSGSERSGVGGGFEAGRDIGGRGGLPRLVTTTTSEWPAGPLASETGSFPVPALAAVADGASKAAKLSAV